MILFAGVRLTSYATSCQAGKRVTHTFIHTVCRSTSLNNVSVSPPVISVYEALLRIESRQFLREMNATLDYSYLDTPRSGAPIR